MAATLAVELGLFTAGLVVYLRTTRARGAGGHISLWSFVAVILLIYAQALFGAPPPEERSLAFFALIGWLIPPWGFWIVAPRTCCDPPSVHDSSP